MDAELINEIATRFITHLMYSGGEFDPEVLMDKIADRVALDIRDSLAKNEVDADSVLGGNLAKEFFNRYINNEQGE